jgi:catechol 2,3-dioxygenase-like lactoylglutathione lyase family enzyme
MTDQTPAGAGERSERRRRDPESLRLRSLSPSLTVDDLEASVRFYTDGLGFTVHERWEEDGKLLGVMLVAGDCYIGLSQDDFSKGRDRAKGIGFRIWADTAQDLDAIAARLDEHGIEHDGPKEQWEMTVLSVTEPDGYHLSLTPPKVDGD